MSALAGRRPRRAIAIYVAPRQCDIACQRTKLEPQLGQLVRHNIGLIFVQPTRMALVVKINVALYPLHIWIFCADAVMFGLDTCTDLIEQHWLVCGIRCHLRCPINQRHELNSYDSAI